MERLPGWRWKANARRGAGAAVPGPAAPRGVSAVARTTANAITGTSNRHAMSTVAIPPTDRLVASALLPDGFTVPASRFTHPSTRMRQLLDTEPFLFGPGVYDPMGAELVMYYGFKAVYFSGHSFAIGHL